MTKIWRAECKTIPAIGEAFTRLNYNFSRIQNLCNLYKETSTKKQGRVLVHQSDILRSAVVLMHAMLEDCLRTIASHYLPLANEEYLNKIPLKGINSSGKPEKFQLGELHKFKGMTIDEVISQSVNSHLDRTTFNTVADISNLLKTLNIESTKFSEFYPHLEKMIKRRHDIVHRADRSDAPGKGKQYANSIRLSEVQKWASQSNQFLENVFTSVAEKGTTIEFKYS